MRIKLLPGHDNRAPELLTPVTNNCRDHDHIGVYGAMLDSLPFRVGPTKAAKAQAGPLSEYDQAAVELRQGELMCMAAGYSLPGDKLLKQVKFPEQTT